MTASAQTLYEVLEVEPQASADEVRAAYVRALETYGPESIAVYALVDEVQVETLRARLAEAAEVLLDPTRRAGYDRSLGLVPPSSLWAEEDEDEDIEVMVSPGPHLPAPEPALTPVSAELGEETSRMAAREAEEATPRQRTLALEIPQEPVRVRPLPEEALLAKDWAAAVEPAGPATQKAASPEPPSASSPPAPPEPVARAAGPSPSARVRPPPLPRSSSFGLRTRLGRKTAPEEPADLPPSPQASPSDDSDPGRLPRPREGRPRLDIPPDAEFNGELLRQVREASGLSLEQVAEKTRITRFHLENVEADRYDHLPAMVYLRGILVNLARELRLDPARVSKSYLLAASRGKRGP